MADLRRPRRPRRASSTPTPAPTGVTGAVPASPRASSTSTATPWARCPRPCRRRSPTSSHRQWGERLIRSWNEADWWGAPSGSATASARWSAPRPGRSWSPTRPRSTCSRCSSRPPGCGPGRRVVLTDPGLLPHRPLRPRTRSPRLLGLEVVDGRPRRGAATRSPSTATARARRRTRPGRLPHRRAVGPRRDHRPRTTPARWCAGTCATRPASCHVGLDAARRRPRRRLRLQVPQRRPGRAGLRLRRARATRRTFDQPAHRLAGARARRSR